LNIWTDIWVSVKILNGDHIFFWKIPQMGVLSTNLKLARSLAIQNGADCLSFKPTILQN
jgi:hypothetical protein